MENNEIKQLQNKIIEALKVASIQLLENKKRDNQKMVVSVDGKIQIITP
jgi:hypothetical protein